MRTFFTFVCWCILLVLCWPLAILVLIFFPLVWLLALPFRLAGVVITATFTLIKSILLLPSRLLGYRSKS